MGRLVATLGVVHGLRFTVESEPYPWRRLKAQTKKQRIDNVPTKPTRKVNVSKISRWPPRRRSDASKNNNLREIGFHRRGPKKQVINGF